MLKISEFSHLAHISGRMLRYYDERGLLKPAYVDPSTGYRYYTLEQLPRFHRLQALKDLGFTLEQIAPLLDQDLSLAELHGMLRLKQAEVQQNIQVEQMRLARIEARLKCIERENEPSPYEVVLKEAPPLLVASVRGSLPDEDKIASAVFGLFEQIVLALSLSAQTDCVSQPWFLLWSQMNGRLQDMQVEAAIPLNAPVCEPTSLRVVELPHMPIMACTLHQGTYRDLPQAIQALYTWAEVNGFYACGLGRE
ncbi:MAG TPA: MerR family transcriptional regulator, partial [Ktedonobacteraceae bacterium]|nr:MerR family transcriptional regulator [Ktedonobacteraceae bacterium]